VLTTLSVTGKPAQFGRGVMNEVGGRLLGIFAANLAATLAQDEGAVPGAAASLANGAGPMRAAGQEGQTTEAAGGTTAGTIDDLKLPARATSSLHKAGIATINQLATKSEDELLAIDGIGPASVDDIKAKLSDLGLTLGQPQAAPAAAAEPATAESPAAVAAPPVVPHASAARHAAHQLEDDAINLLKVAGLPVLKRAIPVLAGVIAALLIGLRAKARRRKH
jgi:uncharacterized protein